MSYRAQLDASRVIMRTLSICDQLASRPPITAGNYPLHRRFSTTITTISSTRRAVRRPENQTRRSIPGNHLPSVSSQTHSARKTNQKLILSSALGTSIPSNSCLEVARSKSAHLPREAPASDPPPLRDSGLAPTAIRIPRSSRRPATRASHPRVTSRMQRVVRFAFRAHLAIKTGTSLKSTNRLLHPHKIMVSLTRCHSLRRRLRSTRILDLIGKRRGALSNRIKLQLNKSWTFKSKHRSIQKVKTFCNSKTTLEIQIQISKSMLIKLRHPSFPRESTSRHSLSPPVKRRAVIKTHSPCKPPIARMIQRAGS